MRVLSLKGHWITAANWHGIWRICDGQIAQSENDEDWRRHLELLYLAGRYNQLVVFYKEFDRERRVICRKGVDSTCVESLKESVYYVKALVSVLG